MWVLGRNPRETASPTAPGHSLTWALSIARVTLRFWRPGNPNSLLQPSHLCHRLPCNDEALIPEEMTPGKAGRGPALSGRARRALPSSPPPPTRQNEAVGPPAFTPDTGARSSLRGGETGTTAAALRPVP